MALPVIFNRTVTTEVAIGQSLIFQVYTTHKEQKQRLFQTNMTTYILEVCPKLFKPYLLKSCSPWSHYPKLFSHSPIQELIYLRLDSKWKRLKPPAFLVPNVGISFLSSFIFNLRYISPFLLPLFTSQFLSSCRKTLLPSLLLKTVKL